MATSFDRTDRTDKIHLVTVPLHTRHPLSALKPVLMDKKSIVRAFAIHIGALNNWRNRPFIDALENAEMVYADGISVVLLARLYGCRKIAKLATTDFGPMVLHEIAQRKERTCRVGIIGSTKDVAWKAGKRIEQEYDAEVVFVLDGYGDLEHISFTEIREQHPDLIIVGLGMPLEALWVHANTSRLPNCVVLTCGGWLRLLAGVERRSPSLIQLVNLEWAYRLVTDPRRVLRRYATGALTMITLAARIIRCRLRGRTIA